MSLQRDRAKLYKKEFWSTENLKFTTPHYRLRKVARLVHEIVGDKTCELLDVGCGPGQLKAVLRHNVGYYGIDIAIREPAPYLLEYDFLEAPVSFNGKRFDIVVAQGVFEYVGAHQDQKFAEISSLLKDDGRFIVSYVNFDHRARSIYWPYSNVQSLSAFRLSLSAHFKIERYFPTAHNWNHSEPGKRILQALQLPMTVNVPVVSRILAVEYFFICSRALVRCSSALLRSALTVPPIARPWQRKVSPVALVTQA
jgi:cyclopropane fatty-acyl-phospholipid synthase-like methyltransferase